MKKIFVSETTRHKALIFGIIYVASVSTKFVQIMPRFMDDYNVKAKLDFCVSY